MPLNLSLIAQTEETIRALRRVVLNLFLFTGLDRKLTGKEL